MAIKNKYVLVHQFAENATAEKQVFETLEDVYSAIPELSFNKQGVVHFRIETIPEAYNSDHYQIGIENRQLRISHTKCAWAWKSHYSNSMRTLEERAQTHHDTGCF